MPRIGMRVHVGRTKLYGEVTNKANGLLLVQYHGPCTVPVHGGTPVIVLAMDSVEVWETGTDCKEAE